jgi:acetolactate synthase small subunit
MRCVLFYARTVIITSVSVCQLLHIEFETITVVIQAKCNDLKQL